MNDFYAPHSMKPGLMTGDVNTPANDQEASALIQKSKAAFDSNSDSTELHKHVKAVASALRAYHKATPSQQSAQIVHALNNDPRIQEHLRG